MRHMYAVFLATTLLASCANAAEWVGIDRKVGNSLRLFEAQVVGKDSVKNCTATIVSTSKRLALTAAHCIPTEPSVMFVDGSPAVVVGIDKVLDLALIRAVELNGTDVVFAGREPRIGEPVSIAGFAFGASNLTFVFGHVSTGFVHYETFYGFTYDALAIAGQSGGVVVTPRGEVLGIAVGTVKDGTQSGVSRAPGLNDVRAFVAKHAR